MNLAVAPTSWGYATPLRRPFTTTDVMAYYNRRRPLVIPLSREGYIDYSGHLQRLMIDFQKWFSDVSTGVSISRLFLRE